MRKLLVISLFFNLMMTLLPFAQNLAHAQVNPWPWAKPLPFPWESIQGTWTEPTSTYTFSFHVIENSWGQKHIKIKQAETKSGQRIAEGVGYEYADGIVVAGMTGGQQRQFLLTIRRFQNTFCWDQRKVTGITIESTDHELITHFEIYKITEIPLTPGKVRDYKQPQPDSLDVSPFCLREIPPEN
jgi:hypothetical protein